MTVDLEALAEAYDAGLAAEKSGDLDAAAAAYERALDLDPDDRCGASVRLAAIGRGPAPDRAPPAYVATLFDQHADVFDTILVDQLGYDAPLQLRDLVKATPGMPEHFERMLDLGCGTGLCAEAFEDMSDHRTGVDLAEEMIAASDDKDLYADLFVGDAETFLRAAPEILVDDYAPWDLIAATDVLPYLGDLSPLFDTVAAHLTAGGVFAFSSETPAEDGEPVVVGPKHRFGHSEGYLIERIEAAGLRPVRLEPIVVRYDEGAPILGHLGLAAANSG